MHLNESQLSALRIVVYSSATQAITASAGIAILRISVFKWAEKEVEKEVQISVRGLACTVAFGVFLEFFFVEKQIQ